MSERFNYMLDVYGQKFLIHVIWLNNKSYLFKFVFIYFFYSLDYFPGF